MIRTVKENSEAIGIAGAKIPSGCSILTVAHRGQRTGMLVSWVQQASFEPLAVSVAVKQGRPAGALIDGSGTFVLNVIGEDTSSMFKQFGRGFSLEEDAFAGVAVEASPYGPLLSDCIAQLGCRILSKVPVGDHDLYVAEVVAGRGTVEAKPYVHRRKSAFSY